VARRHLRQAKDGVMRVGDLVVDSERHYVERGGKRIQLTPKEFQLLEYLALNSGYVLSRSMIAEKIWGHGFESYSNAIDVHVNNLRTKVDRDERRQAHHTVKGLGYARSRNAPRCRRDTGGSPEAVVHAAPPDRERAEQLDS
jgi:DNA-binding response OmpR family regulator